MTPPLLGHGHGVTGLQAPAVHAPVSAVIAAAALTLLIYSFGVDILAQARGS